MANEPTDNPLSEDQIQELLQKIKDTDKAQKQIDMAKRAGVPIGDAEEQLKDVKAQLIKLKNVYAPNRSLIS